MPIKGVLKAGVPVKLWTDITQVESEALTQLKNVANLPFIFKHVAVMADCHLGKGCTVGSVIATKGAVLPCAVGVDIGCGMIAIKTKLDKKVVLDNLPMIRHSIERSIPVGSNGNKSIVKSVKNLDMWKQWDKLQFADTALLNRAMSQCGSLGGGNHFIEICLDASDNVWIMLHSGSRNVGKTLAERHIHEAKGLMKKMLIGLVDPDLSYFPEETKEFDSYIQAVTWCQDYAFQNRIEMMTRVLNCLSYDINNKLPIQTELTVNCHHNYISREHHYGENVIVTRKGAVRAREGDYGIIPSAMGQPSYIVKGKGNPESFMSCSHGAGRKMSRSKAKEMFTLEDVAKQTEGVECRKDGGIIDELPGAYKDIQTVMENQNDLVSIVAEIKAVLCVKG